MFRESVTSNQSTRTESTDSIDEHVQAQGYLVKRGHLIPSWNRRFFELTSNKLTYYVDESKKVMKGKYDLASDMLVRDCNFRPFCFCIFQPGNNRRSDIMYLTTTTMEEKQSWMSIISSSISKYRANKIRRGDAESLGRRVENAAEEDSTAVTGTATIRVIQARNLADIEEEMYPFVLVNIGSSVARSKTATATANPRWDETFSFSIDGTNRFIKFDVTNDNKNNGMRGTVGEAEISLMNIGLAGKPITSWYRLAYRGEGTKKGFGGEIEIEISIAPANSGDEIYEPFMRLLDQVKTLPPIKCTYLNSGIGRDDDEDDDEDDNQSSEDRVDPIISNAFSIFMPQSPPRGRTRSSSSSIGSNTDNITPFNFFPMLHTEVPEDMCSTVALTSTGDDEPVFCMGILILSNLRLLFIENSRVVEPPMIWDMSPAALTTGIALGDILECSMTARYDDTIKSVVDMLRVKTIDGRRFSFGFIENYKNDKDERSNTTGASGWQPPDGVAGGVATKRGEGVSCQETVLFGFVRGNFRDQGVQQAYTDIFKNVLYDYSYIDGIGSFEGPASQRIFQHISIRTNNRYLLVHEMKKINEPTIAMIVSTPGEILGCKMTSGGVASTSYSKTSFEMYLENAEVHRQLQMKFVRGWGVYLPEDEFKRMNAGVKWRICDVNKGYKHISSYPELFIVPKAVNDEMILGSVKFRSKGRLPVLSWINPSNGCSITRCSQPLVGLSQKRSGDDEDLLECINNTTGGNSTLLITDARPKISAQANQAAGKGYESERNYRNSKITFLGMANFHVIRKSYEAVIRLCSRQMKGSNNFMKDIDNSGWLENVRKILDCAVCIAHWNMVDSRNVVVHCNDGWDRTPQLTSLVMLMLDPYYRTIRGFSVLIEKEWCAFGHKFKDRCGWSHLGFQDDDRSPIFEIFLHCVYQVFQEQPTAFEFNESFLLFIAENMYNGYFGNFVRNSDRERKQMLDKSFSIWFFIEENKGKFLSDIYIPPDGTLLSSSASSTSSLTVEQSNVAFNHVVPMVSAKNIIIWQNRFMGWQNRITQFSWSWPSTERGFSEEESNWVGADQGEYCPQCNLKFSMFRRKDTCRICGMVFCDTCLGSEKTCASCRILESPLSKSL